MKHAAVLFDKDGTLLDDVPYNVDPTLMRFAPGAGEALAILAAHGFRLFVISNQSGVALGRFSYDALAGMQAHLAGMFEACGVTLDGAYWCPHHPEGIVARYARRCACRKPQPGLLLRAAREQRASVFEPQPQQPRMRGHAYGLLELSEKLKTTEIAKRRECIERDFFAEMRNAVLLDALPLQRRERPAHPLRRDRSPHGSGSMST